MAEHAQRELDALVQLARGAEPAPLGALDARRTVRRAQAAALRRGQQRKRVSYGFMCAAALLAMAAGFAWQRAAPAGTHIAVGVSDRPLRIALKSGDSLLLAPGSELAVLAQRSERRVRLARGRVLFDVAKLGAGDGFEVEAGGARVSVLGTIFSVEVGEGRTLVRVYEGSVAVNGRAVAAPGVWVSRGAPPEHGDALFEREARQLALARQGGPVGGGSAPVKGPPAPRVSAGPHTRAEASAALAREAESRAALARPAPALGARPQAPSEQVAAEQEPAPVSSSSPRAAEPAFFDLEGARALLAAGDARAALARAQPEAARDDGALLIVADASRALGLHREARAYYVALAQRGAEPLRTRAAFGAAQLAFHALGDPADALALIATFALAADGAPLRERATALQVDALSALGRRQAALEAARRYLAREPETETSARMRELLAK